MNGIIFLHGLLARNTTKNEMSIPRFRTTSRSPTARCTPVDQHDGSRTKRRGSGEMLSEITQDEWKLIRKALQVLQMAHTIVETAEDTTDRDTPIDELIRKVRAYEEGDNDGVI